MTNKATSIGTVGEWLTANFGQSALSIQGFESWGKEQISSAYFVINQDGQTFVSCGGQAIIGFARGHSVDKRPLYLVLDGDRGECWELRRQNGTLPLHTSKPNNVMRLVFSA